MCYHVIFTLCVIYSAGGFFRKQVDHDVIITLLPLHSSI